MHLFNWKNAVSGINIRKWLISKKYNTVGKFGVGKIFECFWKKSLMLSKAVFIWSNNAIMKYYNLK